MKMFKPGLENLLAAQHHCSLKVAVVTNNTGRDSNNNHLVELLAEHEKFEVVKIFSPEHGLFSMEPDGEAVDDSRHEGFNIPVISLYGKNKKPTMNQLEDIDLLIYDIQDTGVRFYTYISTLRNILDAAAEKSIPVWILDRPDVLGGIEVEGPMLKDKFSSFVGHIPVPVRYGLTPGELALWWKNKTGLKIDIKVWECIDYKCSNSRPFPDFPWYKPSPSMPDIATAQFYPGTCLFEGTNVSEGRGSSKPFRTLGAPWINADKWAEYLREILDKDIEVKTSEFVPSFSKYANKKCFGINLSSKKPIVKNAVLVGLQALYTLMQTHSNKVIFTSRPGLKFPFFDYLCGSDYIRKGLLKNKKLEELIEFDRQEVKHFARERQKYFLYQRI
ncbi:MAG: exo-beta-N-acetylmuramidase NamZ family protein [Candidatus Rifleibacteriota bacterium]